MGGQGNPRERNREGGMGEGRERRLGEKNLQKRLGGNRFFLLWRHPPDPDVVCADSAAGDWEVTGDFKNMSILATIDKKAIYKDPTDSKEVPPLDVPELLAYLVRQSGPFLDQIGVRRGAESVVYEAVLDGNKVAMKKPILSTPDHIDKFHEELQMLCKLDHPGIATLVAAHAKPPNYIFFFKFYESLNLAEKLHMEEWNPTFDQVLTISVQLAKALQHLHKLGIVHRNVKPANILLDENLRPHLADFGLAEYKKDLKRVSMEN